MSWLSRFRNALFPQRLDRELAEELRDHLERRAAELRGQGIDPDEAQRRASLQFGNATLLRERSRELRLWSGLELTLQDVRYAWRGIRRSPVVAATAILSLALAIGANTAIYSLLDAALLRPLPVAEPDRLIRLSYPGIAQPGSDLPGERESFSYPLYLELRSSAAPVAQLALASYVNRSDGRGPEKQAPAEPLNVAYLSGDAFHIVGVSAAIGRVFSPDDARVPGQSAVVVLSHEYWRRRFHADPRVVGKVLYLGFTVANGPYRIVGVAGQGFFGLEPGKFVDLWVPASMYQKDAFANPGWSWFRIVGRLAPSITRAQLQARLQPVFRQHQAAVIRRFPNMPPAIQRQFRDATIRVSPASNGVSAFRTRYARPLWIVLAVAATIFLIACANVASLLLARATARAAEMALRISLGAGRVRLVRQLLTESLLLSVLAGGLGWLLALVLTPLLVSLLSTKADPIRFALAVHTRVLLFSALISALATLLFGLLPAGQATGVHPIVVLRRTGGPTGRLRVGRFLIAIQVAFTFCLVVAGAAFLLSLWNLLAVITGLDPSHVAVVSISNEASPRQPRAQLATIQLLQGQLSGLPGVESVAAAPWAIFSGSSWSDQVLVPGKPPSEREGFFTACRPAISPRSGPRSCTDETLTGMTRPIAIRFRPSSTLRSRAAISAETTRSGECSIGGRAKRGSTTRSWAWSPLRITAICAAALSRSCTCRWREWAPSPSICGLRLISDRCCAS